MPEKKISILHLASDEKFIDAANYIFEKAFPGCNHFIIPLSRFNRNLIYVTNKKNIEIMPYGNNIVKQISKKTENYNCVILHGITEFNSTVFLSSKDKNKFIGIIWGGEVFNQDLFPERNFLGELTASIKLPEPHLKERIKIIIRKIIYFKRNVIKGATKSAASSLSYFVAINGENLDLLKEKELISDKVRLVPFTYYPLEYIIKGNEALQVSGNDILLGNSGTITNNHLDAFRILKGFDIGNRKVVVPLSYGDMLYADIVYKKGSELFKDSFRPLREFMSLAEYTRVLGSCGIVIMNHYRPQAFGNILLMVWLGGKVYLSESNSLLYYMKSLGVKIFSIEKELNKENPNALQNLLITEIEHNRSILKKAIGEEKVVSDLKNGILKYFN